MSPPPPTLEVIAAKVAAKVIDDKTLLHQELIQAISRRREHLEDVVARLEPDESSRVRVALVDALDMAANGKMWNEISGVTGLNWPMLHNRSHGFQKLWNEARQQGEEIRKEMRLCVAHERAVEGWEEPVYYLGDVVGAVRKFDNRLLEFWLKADDPTRFRESAAGGNVNAVQVIVEFHKEAPPAPPALESVTIPQPTSADSQKCPENEGRAWDSPSQPAVSEATKDRQS